MAKRRANSLIEEALNYDSAQVYEEHSNYGSGDVSTRTALQNQITKETAPQAFTQNGIGFKAFILAYENQGIHAAVTSGNEKPGESAEKASPLDGLKGKLGSVLEGLFGGDDTPSTPQKALTQINFLNNVKAKVWIPTLDIDVPQPVIYDAGNQGTAIKDFQLYQTCNIVDERLLQSLPPPGSLVVVDYENRQTKTGLTLKYVICTEATFIRLIMAEFKGALDLSELEAYFKKIKDIDVAFDIPAGDPVKPPPPKAAAFAAEEILELAQNYDEDATIPNHAVHSSSRQHATGLSLAHHEFVPYIKAFMFQAWKDHGLTVHINQTYRTPEEHDILAADWGTDANPGPRARTVAAPSKTSYHLAGMAIDVKVKKGDSDWIPTKSDAAGYHKQLWEASGAPTAGQQAGLRWGGSYKDLVHFDYGLQFSASRKNQLLKNYPQGGIERNRAPLEQIV
jgi:hypothetical protein